MNTQQSTVIQFLKDSGLISHTELDIAIAESVEKSKRISEILIAKGLIGEDDMRRMEALALGIPFVDLKQEKISFDVLSLIPEPVARTYNIVAYKKKDDMLEVAMLNVGDLGAIDFIKKKVGLKIAPRLTDTESIKSVLVQYQRSLKAEFGDIVQKEISSLKTVLDDAGNAPSAEDLKKIAQDLPVVRVVETLFKHAIVQNASDIHIEPMEHELVVRYRIDGLLHDAMILPREAEPSITARIKVLSNLKLDEKRLPQDGRFKVELNEDKVSFRVSILPTYYGEKTVMRLLPEGRGAFTLEQLGFHGEGLERIHQAVKLSHGLVLTTGPTGSGKTTTLYTLLDMMNTPDVNISTIEDPVEYQMNRVNQTQVRPEIGFTFSMGLRTLVRQDPDIIMVGEIRDNETASLAINASLTGHLVLSTLHTNSSAGAIPRLVDMKVEPFLLESTLSVVIAQRLVRKLSSDHREQYVLSADEMKSIQKAVDMERVLSVLKEEKIVDPKATWQTIKFWKPKKGIDDETAFKGRMGIHEVMTVTQTIRNLIIKGAPTEEIEAQAKKEGMLSMIEDGIYKAVQGTTTIEEVLRVITE